MSLFHFSLLVSVQQVNNIFKTKTGLSICLKVSKQGERRSHCLIMNVIEVLRLNLKAINWMAYCCILLANFSFKSAKTSGPQCIPIWLIIIPLQAKQEGGSKCQEKTYLCLCHGRVRSCIRIYYTALSSVQLFLKDWMRNKRVAKTWSTFHVENKPCLTNLITLPLNQQMYFDMI